MTVLAGLDPGSLTGNNPGYIVTFHTVDASGEVVEQPAQVLHSDAVEAEISVPVAADLSGPQATVSFVGLPDDLHAKLAAHTDAGFTWPVARVHLFWRDTNRSVGGYLAALLGIGALTAGLSSLAGGPAGSGVLDLTRVAELRVTRVSRRRGERRYETLLTGTDRIAAATAAKLRDPVSVKGLETAARRLASEARVPVRVWPLAPADPARNPDELEFTANRGDRIRDVLAQLAERVELVTGRGGRGMLLNWRGVLHVGLRPVPIRPAVPLNAATGLLAVEALAPLRAGSDDGDTPRQRPQWTVHLRGRADLHPGDGVTFDPPAEGGAVGLGTVAALVGAAAAPLVPDLGGGGSARGYVSGVTHTLGRATGFQTRLTVVELARGDDGWDRRAPAAAADARGAPGSLPEHPDPVADLRSAFDSGMRRMVAGLEVADVGEVRAHRAAAEGDAAAQRTTLWQGTAPSSDGGPGGAVRLPVDRDVPLERSGVPYATPFAWGTYGLVLPRYPGTRVVALHRHGRGEDPVDVGAVWPDEAGPTAAKPGDWWLSLPADVPADRRAALAPGADATPHRGTATNDLIDADGRRVIEVGSLRLRIGEQLPDAGHRPDPAAAGVVLSVEHTDGTTLLQFTKDGDVTLTAKGSLTLQAGKDIVIKAANVNVNVDNRMNVE